MQTPRRKIINMSLDPELVEWLHEWRKSQPAEVPFGRAIDACIRAFRETQNNRPRKISREREA